MVDALDELDRQLLETENALQAIEAQLSEPAAAPSPCCLGERGRSRSSFNDQLPGRWCRASALPTWRKFPGKAASPRGAKARSGPGTFSTEARWPEKRLTEEEGQMPLLHPSDHFLSTSAISRGAFIAPPESLKPKQIQEARRWLKQMAAEANSKEAAAHLVTPGLEGVAAAWQALLKEEDACHMAGDDLFDDASTAAGSDLSELLSVGSAEPPGPGAYEPKFDALRPSLAKGAPSFDRYKGREPRQLPEPPDEAEEQPPAPPPPPVPEQSFTCRGGKILPLPRTRPRRGTEGQRDADAAAKRPLCYDGWISERVEATMPVASLGPGDKELRGSVETGRLLPLQADDGPGPGSYEAPELLPGPAAIIAPEPHAKEEKATPGPTSYDLRQSQAHVYPRGFAADLGAAREDPTQRPPDYVASYGALEPQWEVTRARSPSATIPPEESCEALRASRLMRGRAPPAGTGERLGPGTYSASSAPLLRPDLAVQLWRPLRTGLPEHLHGLFRLRSDSRALLDTEADILLRRRHAAPIILPLPKARLRRSWSAEDIWRFYLPELDSPLGLANFARNLDFEDWQEHARQRQLLEERHARHMWPSLRLSYSLPDLHITHERAPEADFGRGQGRDSGRMNEDEEVEGDVLLLSLEAERELLHPRAPSLVDMGRQIGRSDGTVEDVDDFEELILSPKRPAKRVTCLVDMARDPGRPPDPEMDAHVWAEDHHDRVFCYKPLGGLADDEEELDLLLKPTPQAPSTDFGRPVGRPGLDPRAREEPRQEDEEEDLLLLQWSPPFIPARLPVPPPSPPPHQDAAGLEIPEH